MSGHLYSYLNGPQSQENIVSRPSSVVPYVFANCLASRYVDSEALTKINPTISSVMTDIPPMIFGYLNGGSESSSEADILEFGRARSDQGLSMNLKCQRYVPLYQMSRLFTELTGVVSRSGKSKG